MLGWTGKGSQLYGHLPRTQAAANTSPLFTKSLVAENPGVQAIDLSFLPFCDMDHPGDSTVLPGWPLPSHCNQVRMRGHSWLAPPSEYLLAGERARRGKGPKIEGPPPPYTLKNVTLQASFLQRPLTLPSLSPFPQVEDEQYLSCGSTV